MTLSIAYIRLGLIEDMGGEQRKFELTGPQIVGSTLAAVTAAVAASYLGVAGTVIGAALVSAGTTVGTAVYTHYRVSPISANYTTL